VAHGFSFEFLPYAVNDADRHVDVYRLLKVNLEVPCLLAEIPPKIRTLLDDNKDDNIMSSVLDSEFLHSEPQSERVFILCFLVYGLRFET
jgi:hypothetical protein